MNVEPGSDTNARGPAVAKRSARKAPARAPAKRPRTAAVQRISREERRAMVAEAAYLLAERRNFAPGGEADDWYQAEAAIDAQLAALGVEVRD